MCHHYPPNLAWVAQFGDGLIAAQSVSSPSLCERVKSNMLCKTIAHRDTIEYAALRHGYPGEHERIDTAFVEYRSKPQAQLICYADASRGLPTSPRAFYFEGCAVS
jgi:hypothetical protein